jgi:hypothetical protein
MKKVIALAALTALAGSAYAQLTPLPPSYGSPTAIGANAGAAYWGDTNGLAAFQFAADNNLNTPSPNNDPLGLGWSVNKSAGVNSILSQMADPITGGGSIRVIFLGESAGWWNDFGFTTDGDPKGPNSYSLFNDIQALPPVSNPAFGDHFDLAVGPGQVSGFDFWLSGSRSTSAWNPSSNTSPGGYYTAFDITRGNPATPSVRWSQTALSVDNFDEDPTDDIFTGNVQTWLIGFEDWRLADGADQDFNDFMVAVQFFDRDGRPFTPVPEPSTYGLMGAGALLGLVAWRRRAAKK